MANDDIRKIIETRKKEITDACGITREEVIRNAREVIRRCSATGRRYRPHDINTANRFLADMGGFIVQRIGPPPEEPKELDFGNLPMPHQPRVADKPN